MKDKMKKVLYVGYYDCEQNKKENRNYVLSATNKMTYICSAINRNGYEVEIVSASGTRNNCNYSAKEFDLSPHTKLKLFDTKAYSQNPVKRILRRLDFNFRFFWYMLRHIEKDDKILVYHSLGYAKIIYLLKRLKGFHLILEVEEIYSDVTGNNRTRKCEEKIFKVADSYLFSTELLDEKINTMNKPSVINYGTYQVEKDRKCRIQKVEIHDKINIVYAGTLDPRKGGAIAAAAAAEYLPFNYHIHIIGFGNEEEKKTLQEKIDKIAKKSKAGVSYDGVLSGEGYIRFVQDCQIELSTQMPDAEFNDTSFPSKVLSYLANGLRVVSVRIKALEKSAISDLICYYDEQTPEAIAKTIKQIDLTQNFDGRKMVLQLDKGFVKAIGQLLCQ